jgi:YfiH family protein
VGRSSGRYAAFNLGDHVDDEPVAVAANRAALADVMRPGGSPVVFMQQVHGNAVAVVDAHPGAVVAGVDALVTTRPGLAVAVLVADCVPLVLVDDQAEVAAVVHAGRAGVRADVVGATLDVIANLGVAPARLAARLGPAIGGCCYEVPAAMQDAFCAVVPEARASTRWGTPSLDLSSAVAGQLRAHGVHDISTDGRCTYESAAHYSYRRDGVTGRFAGVVMISG